MSLIELENELAARERRAAVLRRRRAVLAARMAAIDAELVGYGPAQASAERSVLTRNSNDKSLPNALADVLKGKTMSVKDAVTAVQEAGYVTASPIFRVLVNQALIDKTRFKRVERGMYTAR